MPSPRLHVLRSMITKAWTWAKENKRLRTHPVHGEEEIYICVTEGFEMRVTQTEEMTQSGTIEVQDCLGNRKTALLP